MPDMNHLKSINLSSPKKLRSNQSFNILFWSTGTFQSLPLIFFLNQDLSLVLPPPLAVPPALTLNKIWRCNVNHFTNKLANIVAT